MHEERQEEDQLHDAHDPFRVALRQVLRVAEEAAQAEEAREAEDTQRAHEPRGLDRRHAPPRRDPLMPTPTSPCVMQPYVAVLRMFVVQACCSEDELALVIPNTYVMNECCV